MWDWRFQNIPVWQQKRELPQIQKILHAIALGEYATESEVIRDGLRALLARDRAVESWLHNQVGPAYDALKADPSRAVTVDQLRARLAVEHAKAR